MKPKIIFAGTPDFAACALDAIVSAGFEVVLVLTQPDRAKGRGMKVHYSPVKERALHWQLPIMQPETLRDADIQAALLEYRADVMVVAAYGLILPQSVLAMPAYGCLNIHASLLPRWRGAAPIQRAIAAGDTQTGICIMQMDEGLDTGAVLHRSVCAIGDEDTAQDIHDALAKQGAVDIVAVLQHFPHWHVQAQAQEGVCYARKISRADAQIDWHQPTSMVQRQVNAFYPVPVAWTLWQGEVLKVYSVQPVDSSQQARAGEVLAVADEGIDVACGEGVVRICVLQLAGARRMTARDFLCGHHISIGTILGEVQ